MIILPDGAKSHKNAGPYSPVLEIEGRRLVVISGCASQDDDGKVVGETIEEQTLKTIQNCEVQLKKASCDLSNVFKVTVYMRNLEDWSRFNGVYAKNMSLPLPVRTAVQAVLLDNIQVEIEMWAVKD